MKVKGLCRLRLSRVVCRYAPMRVARWAVPRTLRKIVRSMDEAGYWGYASELERELHRVEAEIRLADAREQAA